MARVNVEEFRTFRLKKRIGPKGEQGPIGFRGLEGASGSTGLVGIRGEKGDQGPEGVRGVQGLTGAPGPKGEHGSIGLMGPMPKHELRGDSIRFELEDGAWGKWINLGNQGFQGKGFGGGLSEKRVTDLIAEFANEGSLNNKLIDTVGKLKYVGESAPGTDTSDNRWRIKRIDQTDVGGDVPILYANGNNNFVHIWDDRLGFIYTVTGV